MEVCENDILVDASYLRCMTDRIHRPWYVVIYVFHESAVHYTTLVTDTDVHRLSV